MFDVEVKVVMSWYILLFAMVLLVINIVTFKNNVTIFDDMFDVKAEMMINDVTAYLRSNQVCL